MSMRSRFVVVLAALFAAFFAAFFACTTVAAQDKAAADKKPQQFVYVLRVAPAFHDESAWKEPERKAVGLHFQRLVKAAATGKVILAGRTSEPLAQTFGLVIFESENEAEARAFMEADPAVQAGVMTATLHPYTVALLRLPS